VSNGDVANYLGLPLTTPISTFCVAFYIFLVGERRDFKFGRQVDHGKFQPTDDKPCSKGCGLIMRPIFTTWYYASMVYVVIGVCLSVCVCHTPVQYQNAKLRIMQTMPQDNPGA